MTTIYLVTSGQTNWDTEERIQGSLSVPLNAHGVVQIARLAAEKKPERLRTIYTGEGQDAVQTADILAKAWGAKREKREGLNEVNLGFWQGVLRSEVAESFHSTYKRWTRDPMSVQPPNGEALDAAYRRIAEEMQRLLTRHRKGSVGIVSGPLAAALVKCYLMDTDIRLAVKMCAMPGACEVMECR